MKYDSNVMKEMKDVITFRSHNLEKNENKVQGVF